MIKTSLFRAYHFKASTASSLVDVAIRFNSLRYEVVRRTTLHSL